MDTAPVTGPARVVEEPRRLGAPFARLWSASAMSNLADGVFQVALPLLALRLTRSPALIAGVSLAARLPWLLFALQAGALADRLDRRRTMVHVDLVRVVLIGGLAGVVALGREELAVLYVVAFVLGIGETLFDTAAQSILPMVVRKEDLSKANGRLFAVEIVANEFVGPPLGGLLAGTAIALAFAGSAACYAVAALALFALRGRYRPMRLAADGTPAPPVRLRTDIVEGLRYLRGHRVLRTFAFMTGVGNLSNSAALAVLPLYAVAPGPMGLSASGFGLLLAAPALGMVAGSVLVPRLERRLGRSRLLATSVVSFAIMSAAPLLTRPALVGAVQVVAAIPFLAWNVIVVSLRQRIVPEELLGRVNASYRLLAWGAMPIGSALGGLLAGLFGIRVVFAFSGLANLALLACMPLVSDRAIEEADTR